MSSAEGTSTALTTVTNSSSEVPSVFINAPPSIAVPMAVAPAVRSAEGDKAAASKQEKDANTDTVVASNAVASNVALSDMHPPTWQELLRNNRAWASRQNPLFFERLKSVQEPEFLWIGCSDSRVLTNTVTCTSAGQIFVHRNIANLVVPTDFNMLCVLDYAVNHLKVKHVIVCGHYGCGGVHAAMSRKDYNKILNGWLRHIKMVYFHNKDELDAIEDDKEKEDRLAELNVIQQVYNLAHTSTIQRVWRSEKTRPHLHGWVYDIGDGLIKPVVDLSPNSQVHSIFEYHM